MSNIVPVVVVTDDGLIHIQQSGQGHQHMDVHHAQGWYADLLLKLLQQGRARQVSEAGLSGEVSP